jgi:hypothetical protein
MGPLTVQKYGEAILQLLRQPAADPASAAPSLESLKREVPPPVETTQPIAPARASHYWTWRLLSKGFTPDECAQIRGLAPEVVLDHALRAADEGLRIDAAWFLAPELVAQIERQLGPAPPTRLRSLLEHLPRGTRYEEVQLVLQARFGATASS